MRWHRHFQTLHLVCCSFVTVIVAQSAEDVAFSTLSFGGILNSTWDTTVRQVCSAAATTGAATLSLSGLIACYNVAAVQPSTGLFLGDLRLYVAGQSSLSTASTLQLRVDFAKVAVIRNATESQGSNVQTFQKRALTSDDDGFDAGHLSLHDRRQVAVGPGSQAAVASPQPGIKPIVATARLGESTTPAAILPGERPLAVVRRAAVTASFPGTFTSSPLNVSGIRAANTGLQIPGTQVQTIQFLGNVIVETALSNPDGSGVIGALLPSISILVSTPGQVNQTLSMNEFTRSFLTGVKGRGRPAGTFVLPGRKLGGADGSASLVGLYLVSAYTLVLLVTLVGGMATRWSMRREYRSSKNR